jgi:hypothetical protein
MKTFSKVNVTARQYTDWLYHPVAKVAGGLWGLCVGADHKKTVTIKITVRVFHDVLQKTDIEKGILSKSTFAGLKHYLTLYNYTEKDLHSSTEWKYDPITDSSLRVFIREFTYDNYDPTKLKENLQKIKEDITADIEKVINDYVQLED